MPDVYIVPESHVMAANPQRVRRMLSKLPMQPGAIGVENTLNIHQFSVLMRGRPGARLQDLMPEAEARELWRKLESAAEAAKTSPPPFETFYSIQPFFASATFFSILSAETRKGIVGQPSTGRPFSSAVVIEKPTLPVVWLDDVESGQNQLFHCSNQEQVKKLFLAAEAAAKSIDFQRLQIIESRAALASGDLDRLLSSFDARINNEYARILYECNVTPRNNKWIGKILENQKKYGPVLYVVGAWHIYGQFGLISILSRLGFTIEEI